MKFAAMYKQFKTSVGENVTISKENICDMVRFAMEFVEETTLDGPNKKTLAVRLIKKLTEDVELKKGNEERELLLFLLKNQVVESMIDLVVDAVDGNVSINKVKSTACGCCFASKKNAKKVEKKT